MAWPPNLKNLPPILSGPLSDMVAEIDRNKPIDGFGARVSRDKSGSSINASGGDSGSAANYDVWRDGVLTTERLKKE